MSLNYDKEKNKENQAPDWWGSNADLYTAMSTIFLMLYVVTSLRMGTSSIEKQMETKRMTAKANDLERQIQAYNALKEDSLKQKSEAEQVMYAELMDKLELLQDQASDEADELRNKADNNQKKQMALNKYQQVIRNIINTNMLAKDRIARRDDVIERKKNVLEETREIVEEQDIDIEKKSETIAEQENTIVAKQKNIEERDSIIENKRALLQRKEEIIKNLGENIEEKKQLISKNNMKIDEMSNVLANKITELTDAQQKHKTSKKSLEESVLKLRRNAAAEIRRLQGVNQEFDKQLNVANSQIETIHTQLVVAKKTIDEEQTAKQNLVAELQELEAKKDNLEKSLEQKTQEHEQQVVRMQKEHMEKAAQEKSAFLQQLKQEKISAAEKARRLADFQKEMAEKEEFLKVKINELKMQVTASQSKADDLKKQTEQLTEDLKIAKDREDIRRKLSGKIVQNFQKSGIDAQVDEKTGEVIMAFGQEYFDAGQAQLKGSMQQQINKFMPIYSESLFADPEVANQIQNVEIIGFSSPTYQGKYIDPDSLGEGDKAAVSYNLDLSFYRAKSIFNYIFDQKKISYPYQKELYKKVKVTGKSFLAEEIKGRGLASGVSAEQFCKQYDCKKAQRVIIKFNLK